MVGGVPPGWSQVRFARQPDLIDDAIRAGLAGKSATVRDEHRPSNGRRRIDNSWREVAREFVACGTLPGSAGREGTIPTRTCGKDAQRGLDPAQRGCRARRLQAMTTPTVKEAVGSGTTGLSHHRSSGPALRWCCGAARRARRPNPVAISRNDVSTATTLGPGTSPQAPDWTAWPTAPPTRHAAPMGTAAIRPLSIAWTEAGTSAFPPLRLFGPRAVRSPGQPVRRAP